MSGVKFQWLLLLAGFILCNANLVVAKEPVSYALPDLDGNMHDLARYRGKWVVVNFWATSCPPCIKEIPELVEFHKQHKDHDAVVVGVNHEDIPLSWLRQFMNTVPINYPVLRSSPSRVTPFGLVQMLPSTYIISPDGRSIARRVGTVTAAQLDSYIEKKNKDKVAADN